MAGNPKLQTIDNIIVDFIQINMYDKPPMQTNFESINSI